MIAAASLLGVLLTASQAAVATPAPSAAAQATPPRVEIELFSDFQCPFCARFAEPFREVQTTRIEGVEVHVTFRHYPLIIHPRAPLAHQAALAAAEQGRFWEMHDLLFANQSRAQRDDLLSYAKTLGLNVDRFSRDIDSDRIKQAIEGDKAEGTKRRITGTPTFYVNGKTYVGAMSAPQLTQLVSNEARRVRAVAEIADSAMSRGPATAPVTIELFADLQSPVTARAVRVVDEVMAKYPAAVRLQFRNFPLAFHPQAALAHEAAMTAARSGRFWEFARFVLDHQDSLREQDLIALARQAGLDEAAFAASLRAHRDAPRVDADVQAGARRGIRGSPVVLVNGRRIDGVPSLQTLTEYVEAELAKTAAHSTEKQP